MRAAAVRSLDRDVHWEIRARLKKKDYGNSRRTTVSSALWCHEGTNDRHKKIEEEESVFLASEITAAVDKSQSEIRSPCVFDRY